MPRQPKPLLPNVEQHGGSFTVRLNLRDPDTGRRHQPRVTAATMDELLEAVARVRREWATRVQPETMTVAEWLDTWLAGYKRRASSKGNHERAVRLHIRDSSIGSIPLTALTPAQVQRWVDAMSDDEYAPGTVRVTYGTLRAALRRAVALGMLPTSPCTHIELPERAAPSWTILTREEAWRLIDGTRGERYHALWTLAVTCGLRIGELVALRWSDYDARRGRLSIQRTMTRTADGGYIIGSVPKTASSRRTIPLPPVCIAALRDERQLQDARRADIGDWWLDDDAVWDKVRGEHWLPPAGLWWEWARVRSALDLPPARIHDLRHTAASHLLGTDLPITTVSHLLGHADAAVTLRVYGHLLEERLEDAVGVLDDLYRPANGRQNLRVVPER